MKRHRWTWTLAALLGIGLGAYEGLRRWNRSPGKPHRTQRLDAIGDALDDARGWSDWSERQERAA